MKYGVLVGMLLSAGAASAGSSLQGQLGGDTTWAPAGSPYMLTGDVIVPAGVTLTVQPGVEVIAAATDGASGGTDTKRVELIVRGTLRALGTEARPTTFKAVSAGADTWSGLRVEAGTTSTLSGVLIRDAVQGLEVKGTGTSVTLTSSTLTANSYGAYVNANGTLAMESTQVYANKGVGIYFKNGNGTLVSDTITANSGSASYGIYLANGATGYSVTLRNSIITQHLYGIYSDTRPAQMTLSHNNVWGNGNNYLGVTEGPHSISANPLFVSASNLRLTSRSPARHAASDGSSDLGALPYTGDPTPFLAGTLHEDTTLSGDLTLEGDLTVPPGVTVTVAPGTTFTATSNKDVMKGGVDPNRVELIARGTLLVQGTDASPITFKASSAGNTQWRGVRVEAGTQSRLSRVLIRDAGVGLEVTGSGTTAILSSSTLTANDTGAAASSAGTLDMDHTLVHSNSSGVVISEGRGTLLYNTIAANRDTGLSLNNRTSGNSITVRNSIVTANGTGISLGEGALPVTLSHNNVWKNSGSSYNTTAGPHSISANPLFVSPSNFRLTSRSPARHAASDGSSDLGALPYTGDPTPFLAGTLHEDTTLSGALTLEGDLTVPAGVTVTVAPGTTFTARTEDVMEAGADTTQVEVIARGTLRALGTRADPVTFRCASSGGSTFWRGVRVETGTDSLLSGVLIRDARYGLEVTGAGTRATVSSSHITANTYGVIVSASGTLAMDHTLVLSNTLGGVSIDSGNATLRYDTLASSSGPGVSIAKGTGESHVSLLDSIVTRNSYGLSRASGASGTVTLSHNDFWRNSSADYFGVAEGPSSFSADPLFVSASDYHLQTRSPCRGTGQEGTDLGAFPYENVTVTRVEIIPRGATVGAQQTSAFMARALNSEGSPVSGVPFTWSAQASAGTIDAQGVFTAGCTPGTVSAAVTATSPNGLSASADVTLEPGPATQLTLSPSSAAEEAGATRLFSARVQDGCGNSRADSVTWSTAPGAGTITPSGEYTAPCTPGGYPGAVIARLGSLSARAEVSVSPGALAQLGLSPLDPSLSAGDPQTFSAVATDRCGNSLSAPLSWSLINGGGSLSSEGVFTAGTTPGFYPDTVQVSSGSQAARTSVTVTGGPIATLELGPRSATLEPEGQVSFTATARDAYGNVVPASPTWSLVNGGGSLSPSGVFTAGTVAGTYPGTVRAVAGSASATATVTVTPGPAARLLPSPSPATLSPGGSVRFTARVEDAFGNPRSDAVTWSLVTPAAGTLSASGDFTATSVAGAYPNALRAEAGGRTASVSVTVEPGALSRLTLTPAAVSLQVGGSVAFSVQGFDAQGNEVPLSPRWEVVNGGGVLSSSGTFTAGTTAGAHPDTVRVSASGLSASASVEVQPGPVARVLLSPTRPSLLTRATSQFTARAEDAFGNEQPARPRVWSAHAAAGSITATGLFTAGGTPGFHSEAIEVHVDGVRATTGVELVSRVARVEVRLSSVTSLPAGGSVPFTARAFDASGDMLTDVAFTWSARAAAGTIDSSGTLSVACTTGPVDRAVTATAEGTSSSVDLFIHPGDAAHLALAPDTVTLDAGGTTPFTASATDTCGNALPPSSVVWSTPSGAGSITPAGLYTAPCGPGSLPGAVMARLGGLTASAHVTVRPGALASLALEPSSATLAVTEQQQFSVRAADACGNALAPPVEWQVVAGGGTVGDSGLFTAGTVAGVWSDTLRVRSGSLVTAAHVTVVPGPTARVELSPQSPSVTAGATIPFTARARDAHGNERPARPQWISDSAAGSITPEGLFTAGTAAGDVPHAVTATVDGVSVSTSVRVLASSHPDGGTDGGTGGGSDGGSEPAPRDPPRVPGGCGCSSGADASVPLLALFVLGLAVTRRRRREIPPPRPDAGHLGGKPAWMLTRG